MHVETIATLYYPFPLFKVFVGRSRKDRETRRMA